MVCGGLPGLALFVDYTLAGVSSGGVGRVIKFKSIFRRGVNIIEELMADATTVFSQGVSMLQTFTHASGVNILDLIIVFAGGSAALFLVGRAINVAR